MEPISEIERELDRRIEALGFELVEAQWSGAPQRPILRIRIDLPDSEPGRGVTVQDCARVSRALEEWLDEDPAVPERYVLEVSSPGVERPLLRERDFRRFVGHEVRVKVKGGKGSSVREGALEGVESGEAKGSFRVLLRGRDGEVVGMSDDQILGAHLVFDWEGGDS
ncbi:MAG: ribosome maturation factor RimP [Gemmatimonadota bacterium]